MVSSAAHGGFNLHYLMAWSISLCAYWIFCKMSVQNFACLFLCCWVVYLLIVLFSIYSECKSSGNNYIVQIASLCCCLLFILLTKKSLTPGHKDLLSPRIIFIFLIFAYDYPAIIKTNPSPFSYLWTSGEVHTGLFLNLLCSIDLFNTLMSVLLWVGYYSFKVILKLGNTESFKFVLSFQHLCCYSRCFAVPHEF